MDLAAILEALKGLSPLLGALALLLVGWIYWLKHSEAKEEASIEKAKEEALDAKLTAIVSKSEVLSKKTMALESIVKNIEGGNATMLATVVAHENKAEQRFTQQVDVLVQIHEQLVRLNAAHATVINTDNAKRIIQYQWAWCRDECSRLIVNSIRNNSFRGREDIVSRKVYDFWRKAAENSLESLLRLEGLQYPYKHLYTSHLSIAWSLIWSWAVPVYHSAHGDSTFELRLTDLENRTRTLFDQILATHYSLVEDIDHGLIYTDEKAQKDIAVVNDPQAARDMEHTLKTFKVGSTDRMHPAGGLRALMAKAIEADRKSSDAGSSGLRIKSGLFEPPK